MPLAAWVHNLDPFLVRFSENFGIRWYGLSYLLGFAAAVGLLHLYHRRGRSPFGGNTIADLITYLVIGVLAGGRFGYFLLYQAHAIPSDPLLVFRVWEGGMASHGAFVGVGLALLWWCRKRQVPFLQVGDLIVTVAPAGICLGRIANFINGELWGKITDVPWAVVFPLSGPPGKALHLLQPRHPSQLYQAALEGALLFAYMQVRFWRRDPATASAGRLSGEFFIGYAVLRMIGELFREPDAALLFGLSRGTFYSIFLIAAGAVLIVRSRPAVRP